MRRALRGAGCAQRRSLAGWTRQMRAIHTFMRGIEDLISARLQFHNKVTIISVDKLASEPLGGLEVAITPATVASVRIIPLSEVDRRSCGTKVGSGRIILFHFSTFNTKQTGWQANSPRLTRSRGKALDNPTVLAASKRRNSREGYSQQETTKCGQENY